MILSHAYANSQLTSIRRWNIAQSLQLLKVAFTVEKKKTECVSSVSKRRPTEFLFTPFLSHLYNVKKLDS